MARYKVIVPRLNVRQAPVSDFSTQNILSTVSEGLILDLEEVTDVPNPGLGKWYRDVHGQHYWGGGLQAIDSVEMLSLPQSINFNPKVDHWWITDYGIDKIWEQTKGAGVKVAVIDSGLDYNHTNIKSKQNIEYFDVITGSSDRKDCFFKNYYHGTKCAGILAANGPDIYGVAPEVDLLIINATINGNLNADKLILAIKKAIELKAKVISISYDYDILNTHPLFKELYEAVKEAFDKNILIVASVGNDSTTNPVTERYPASFEYCLSVGSIDKNNNLSNYTLNENIDLLAPGEDLQVLTANNLTEIDSGTSFSTPFVAGICALYLSQSADKNISTLMYNLKKDSLLKEEIKKEVAKYTEIEIPDLGVINSKKLFNI